MHVQPGRGSAFVRTKLKNLLTGTRMRRRFDPGEKFQLAEVSKQSMQFTYMDDDDYVFMNMESFEELRVPPQAVNKFVKEGMDCAIAAVEQQSHRLRSRTRTPSRSCKRIRD